ncbi:MAG: hypothetical protein WB630_02945 [Candidatus Acidiferrales bacterium]
MAWTRGEKYLATSFVLGICHHIDHVLRYDHSGWPFRPEVTPFTYSGVKPEVSAAPDHCCGASVWIHHDLPYLFRDPIRPVPDVG